MVDEQSGFELWIIRASCPMMFPWVIAWMCSGPKLSDVSLLNFFKMYFVTLLLMEGQNDSVQLWALETITGKCLFHELILFTATETWVNAFIQLGRYGQSVRMSCEKWWSDHCQRCNACHIVNSCSPFNEFIVRNWGENPFQPLYPLGLLKVLEFEKQALAMTTPKYFTSCQRLPWQPNYSMTKGSVFNDVFQPMYKLPVY